METTASAHEHGVSTEDMQHALRHHLHAFTDTERGFTMYIGPSTTGKLLEVGIATHGEDARIVHAMVARPKFLPRRLRT